MITYFFPEYTGLRPVSTEGPIPRKGNFVKIEDLRIQDHIYSEYGVWTVKEIYYSVIALTRLEDIVKYMDNPYKTVVQVILHKGRRYVPRKIRYQDR